VTPKSSNWGSESRSRVELLGRDLAIGTSARPCSRKAVVGRLASFRTPLLGVLADDFDRPRGKVAISIERIRAGLSDLRAEREGRGDRRLTVILRRYEFDRGPGSIQSSAAGPPASEARMVRRPAGRTPSRLRTEEPDRSFPRRRARVANRAFLDAEGKRTAFPHG